MSVPNPISMALLSLGRGTRWMLMHHIGHRGYDRVPNVPAKYTSKVFARGLNERGALTVHWGADGSSVCRIAYALPVAEHRRRSPGIQTVESVCQADSSQAGIQ